MLTAQAIVSDVIHMSSLPDIFRRVKRAIGIADARGRLWLPVMSTELLPRASTLARDRQHLPGIARPQSRAR